MFLPGEEGHLLGYSNGLLPGVHHMLMYQATVKVSYLGSTVC